MLVLEGHFRRVGQEGWGSTPLNFHSLQEDLRGRAVGILSGVTLVTNGVSFFAKGHLERPLAEVFSQMPRCAPLRLFVYMHVGCHS
jgi:hypothetical protein